MASRHLARSIAMQSLYEWDFYGKKHPLEEILERNIEEFGPGLEDGNKDFVRKLAYGAVENMEYTDAIIEKAAPEWPIDQITIVDRNVLRLGLFELIYGNKEEVPPKVAINEAIELGKNFSGESSGKFVNGVLGTVFRELETASEDMPAEEAEKEKTDSTTS
jgi:transcription antitermination protein NusB